MSGVSRAIETLRSALHKKGVDRHVQDAFSHLTSCLVLLSSSTPSMQMINRLRSVLRQPLLPLYEACLDPSLQLSSALLSAVLDKLCDSSARSDEQLNEAWDATAEVILSGVLDFLEQKDDAYVESEATAWESLSHIICDFFFSDSSRVLPIPSIPLSLSAFNTLTEIAVRQPTVQSALRDKAVLGGERLGVAIARTKDYLLAEALLNLFARLLPPVHNTSHGKFQRVKFVQAVLGSPKLFKCSAELINIIQSASSTLWDDVAAQIIDALARSDITYPQPFPIDEIDVCGRVFLQPLATDRLIMDKQAFLVNVVTENDDPCESLQVPYTSIRTVTIDNSLAAFPTGKALITLDLTSPPLVANTGMQSLEGNDLYAKFLLQSDVMGRFMEALRRRGVGKLTFTKPLTKPKPSKTISLGSGVRFGDDVVSLAPTSSFEDKVQLVNQVYNTNIEDATTSEAIPPPTTGKERPASLSDADVIAQQVTLGQINPAIPHKHELSLPIQLSPLDNLGKLAMVTKAPGDEDVSSDISEFEPEIDLRKKRGTKSLSAACKPNRRGKQGAAKRRRIGESDRTSNGSIGGKESSSELTSRPQESSWSPLETKKPLVSSDSPEIDWSSSTRVDVSPRGPVVGTDVSGNQLPFSHDPPGTHTSTAILMGLCIKDDALLDENLAIESARTALADSLITDIGLAERASLQDGSPPPKIAGSRRKREAKSTILEGEVSGPLHKRVRRAGADNHTPEERLTPVNPIPNAVVPRAKRYSRKKAKEALSAVDPPISGLDELAEKTKSTRTTMRRSERIKEKRTTATSGTPTEVPHSKIRKGKQGDARLTSITDTNKSDAISLPDSSDQISPGTVGHSSPISAPTNGGPFRPSKTTQDHSTNKMSIVEKITPVNRGDQEILQVSSIQTHGMNGPIAKSSKALWEVFDPLAASNMAQPQGDEGFRIGAGKDTNNAYLAPGTSPIKGDAIQPEDVIEYSVSLRGSEDSSELFRPTELTPRKGVVTIDLTLDDSPIQEKRELRGGAAVQERSNADVHVPPDQPELTPTKQVVKGRQATISHQNKRRNVTFASPIHYMLDKELESESRVSMSKPVIQSTQAESASKGSSTSCRSPSQEMDFLSPLIIPTASANIKYEPFDQVLSQNLPPKRKTQRSNERLGASPRKVLSHTETMNPPTSDEVDLQDIVDVLDHIQAAILKRVADRFEKVRKNIRKGRDELLQQVSAELQRMAIDNAQYFNELLGLEEAYHENARGVTRCWEDLIDCNESILVHFRNVLKEHDQNVQKLLPKSLSALKPVFARSRLHV